MLELVTVLLVKWLTGIDLAQQPPVVISSLSQGLSPSGWQFSALEMSVGMYV